MTDNSSPLFWLVLAVLVSSSLWAYVVWRRAWNKLSTQELTVIKRLINAHIPQSFEEAEGLLPAASASISIFTLRRALQTGIVQADTPEYYDWIQTPRYLAGVFVFIGLLGTILGIAVSVSSLGEAVSTSVAASDQLSDISRHIFDLLSGMKYAFYCTIGGLLATLLISALNAFYLSHCRQAETQVEALAYRLFIPLHTLNNRLPVHAEEALPEVATSLRQSVDNLTSTTAQLSGSMIPSVKTFEQTALNTANLAAALLDAGSTLREELQGSSERIETVRKTMEFAGEEFHETLNNLTSIASDLNGAASQLVSERTNLNSAVKEAALEMSGSVRVLQETVTEALTLQQQRLDQLVSHAVVNQDKMSLLLRQFEMTLADVTAITEQSTLRQDVQRLVEQLHLLHDETVAASPQRELATIRGGVVTLSNLVQTVETKIGEVANRSQRLDTNIGAVADQISQVRRQVSALDEQQSVPVSKRLPRVFQRDYWI